MTTQRAPLIVFEPGSRSSSPSEMWRQREVLVALVRRELGVRYKQTVLGLAWTVIQPAITVAVLWVFLGRLGGLSSTSGATPYALLLLAGMLPWQIASRSVSDASPSLVNQRPLITKVYFPRLFVILAPIAVATLDGCLVVALSVVVMAIVGHAPGPTALFLPLFVILAAAASAGIAVWLAVLIAKLRDLRHALPVLIQAWLLASPVAYPSGIVPESWRWLYALNPMVGVIDGFRWCLLPGSVALGPTVAIAAGVSVLLLLGGLPWFHRFESGIADEV